MMLNDASERKKVGGGGMTRLKRDVNMCAFVCVHVVKSACLNDVRVQRPRTVDPSEP